MKHSQLSPQTLPVLEALIKATSSDLPDLSSIAFVCVQHLLFTTISLMDSLLRLGASPDNIHIMGKSYSSSPLVADYLVKHGYRYYPNTLQKELAQFAEYFKGDILSMWQAVCDDVSGKNIKLIVILDDGGVCLTNVPTTLSDAYSLVGVEQTSSGLANLSLSNLAFPVIEVASSAVKQIVESPMISEAVVEKLKTVLPMKGKTLSCGVVGMGSIGTAVTQKLLSLKHRVKIYDTDPQKVKSFNKAMTADHLEDLLSFSDYVFGCAGYDVTKNLKISSIDKTKTFISCSSQDKEFLSLLKICSENQCTYQDVLDHIACTLNGYSIHIIRGGFPVNLDNSGESVDARDIQLTRGLLLGGVLQAITMGSRSSSFLPAVSRYMLNPSIQAFVVSHWRPHGSANMTSLPQLNLFENHAWIMEHSGGMYEEDPSLEGLFQPTAARKNITKVA